MAMWCMSPGWSSRGIVLADRDPDVVAMAAQQVWLAGIDGGRVRRHVPDLLLAIYRDGRLAFVDVKAGLSAGGRAGGGAVRVDAAGVRSVRVRLRGVVGR